MSLLQIMKGAFFAFAIALLQGCATPTASESSYNMGVFAYRTHDYAGARHQWRRAVEEGEVAALNNLGYLLYEGLGGEPDQAQAVALWRQAALLQHSEAQWHLGQAFEDGTGIPRNLVEAYAWYRCAIANAGAATSDEADVEGQIAEGARKSLASVLRKLNPDQWGAAERLARDYIDSHARRRGA